MTAICITCAVCERRWVGCVIHVCDPDGWREGQGREQNSAASRSIVARVGCIIEPEATPLRRVVGRVIGAGLCSQPRDLPSQSPVPAKKPGFSHASKRRDSRGGRGWLSGAATPHAPPGTSIRHRGAFHVWCVQLPCCSRMRGQAARLHHTCCTCPAASTAAGIVSHTVWNIPVNPRHAR